MFRRDELKIIFDLGLLEFVDAEPMDGSALILRVGCIYVLRVIWESEFMGKEKTTWCFLNSSSSSSYS